MLESFDAFESQWLSQRVADPTLGAVGMPADQWYQCVSLIKQYLRQCYGIEAGFWGNAIDYWANTNASLLNRFDRLETTDVARGDIVPLRTLGYDDYTEPGHIVIATGNQNTTQFEALEQNGATGSGTGLNGDAIRTRWITKSRIPGLLRFKPAPIIPQYQLQPFSPHEMILTGDVSMWDLSTPQADIAVGNYSNGYRFMAQGKALHNDGRVYYLPDVTIPHGFLDENCVDYVLLPPAPPSAPVPIPTSTDPYTIVKTILAFSTSNDAVNYINAKGTVAPGNYYIFNRRTVAETGQEVLNVTKVVGQAGSWINPIDNIREPEPIPEPPTPVVVPEVPKPTPLPIDPPHSTNWKATYKSFNPQRIPLVYKALTNLVVSDISGSRGGVIRVPKGQHINVYGTFTRNNTKYGRLKIKADIEFKYFYGVRLVDIQKMATFNLTPLTRAMDYLSLNKAKVETFEDDAIKFLDMPFKIFKKNKR